MSGSSSVEEWLELESDPGVFSLLVEDYGVRGVKVEEIYDISQQFESQVFGFVFLFRYEVTDRRARKKARVLYEMDSYITEAEMVNKMFYAHQIITNSCATHALISVLLNCPNIDIGPNLTKLKEFTQGLDPESKGFAIANMMELAHIHNKHARPPRTMIPTVGGRSKPSVVSASYAILPDTYHYVSFVPINGRLFELDGLKEYPIDHGPWAESEKWTDLFQRTVTQRLLESQDCLFNLLALVPDPVPQISECLKKLQEEQSELLENAVNLAQEIITEQEKQENKIRILKEPEAKSTATGHVADGEKPLLVVKPEPIAMDKSTPEELAPNSIPVKELTDLDQNDKSEATINDNQNVEEPMDCAESAQPNKAAIILADVSKNLPEDSNELNIIADRFVDNESQDDNLQIVVAKVLRNYKKAEEYKSKLKEEIETKQRFRIEHSRRIHDYDAFIFDFVRCLAHNKQLPERLLKRPVVLPALKGNIPGRRKKKRGPGRPRTTLLVNGDVVS